MAGGLLDAAALLLAEHGVGAGHGALGHGDYGEVAPVLAAVLDGRGDLFDVVGYLGNEHYVGAGGDAGVERQPAGVAAHELDHEHAAVRARSGMDVVDDVRGDVDGALEAEGGVRAPDVVVDGLGQGNDIHTGVHEQLRALLSAVAAHDNEAVEVQAVVGVQHRGHEVVALVVHYGLSGYVSLARGAEDGPALNEDAGKVAGVHELVVALDEALVAVVHAVDLDIVDVLEQRLANAADGRVQALTVAARGNEADSGVAFHKSPSKYT